MTAINVVMSYLVGGAYVGLQRIAKSLPQYRWDFTASAQKSDIVIYMNDHRHYTEARKIGAKNIIQRKTGVRSLKVVEPEDLAAVICASRASYDHSTHPNKTLIYNGIDFDYLKTIEPKSNIQLLCAESRHGVGQRTDTVIAYAQKHRKHLTILGSGKGVAEKTYAKLKAANPQCDWVGRVSPDEALSYIKGCEAILIANPSHGTANQCLEAVALGKKIITLTNIEIPCIKDIDLKNTAAKYNELFKSILTQSGNNE